MALTVPNVGEQVMLDAATGKTTATVWTLRLYTNTPTLSGASVASNFTEATGGGYAAITLTAASWTTTPGAPTSTGYPKQTFTFTGPLTTYPNLNGYYVTTAGGVLVFAEALSAAFTPANNGDTLDVTLNVTLGSVVGD
jgi:phage baseplate assembly protein gpV